MNPYLKNVNKLEFVITDACTGACKHCSQGKHKATGAHIDPHVAAKAVTAVSELYALQTVMTFGGEPLLYPDAVFAVHRAARDAGVPRRQVITNGFFSKCEKTVREVALGLQESGVNEILLSVDAFHQETIPMEPVKAFALAVKEAGIPTFLQPAWLVSREDANPYNGKTREILQAFRAIGLTENDGNVVFPEGNALVFLKEYMTDQAAENPYREDPCRIRCLSVDADGLLFGKSLYELSVESILKQYQPT